MLRMPVLEVWCTATVHVQCHESAAKWGCGQKLTSVSSVRCTSIIQCHESPAEFGFEQKVTSVSSPRPQLATPSGHLAWTLIDYQHHPRSHHPTLYHPIFNCQQLSASSSSVFTTSDHPLSALPASNWSSLIDDQHHKRHLCLNCSLVSFPEVVLDC